MKTLIFSSVLMVGLIGGMWWYADRHVDSASYVFPPPERAADSTVPEDEVVIRVDGEPVTRTEFELALASYPEEARGVLMTETGRRAVAEELIRLTLLAQRARQEGIEDREDVRRRLAHARTEGELMRKNILAQAAIRAMLETEQPGTLRDLYEKIKEDFVTADTRQIVVTWEGSRLPVRDGGTRNEEEARRLAEEIAERWRSGREPYEELRARYSDDQGTGELGQLRRDSTPPEFAGVIFDLEPGKVSDPVKSGWGYHVFQVTNRQMPTFAELEQQLGPSAQQLWARAAVEDLREKAVVEFDDDYFRGVLRVP
jgi:peptidyl-prolyl cis-trans isomerase C